MAATLIDTLPQFRLDFDLTKALQTYTKTRNSYAEGSLSKGVFNRDTQVSFQAKLAANGVQMMGYDGRTTYTLPITLGKKEQGALQALGNRMVEEASRQTEDDEDKWEFVPSARGGHSWNVKIKQDRMKNFVPVINGGEVTKYRYENTGQMGEKVEIVGTFGIWMNPEKGQYGIKFDATRITF